LPQLSAAADRRTVRIGSLPRAMAGEQAKSL
jgi:hypothetical protein